MATGGNIPVTELDFFQIKDNLKSYLSNQNEFKDYDFDGSAMSILLDVLAYNTHYMGFYANMVANEMFLDSAVTRNAIVSRAKELGHTPSSTKAAGAEIYITYNDEATSDGTYPEIIPIGTIFSGTNEEGQSFNFVNTDLISIAATGGSGDASDTLGGLRYAGATANVYEGSLKTVSYLFDAAEENPTFEIPSSRVDTSHLQVRIQNSTTDGTGYYSPWTKTTNFTGLTSGSEIYFLQEKQRGRYEIYFGDGIVGKKPSHGNLITVNYLETNGPDANNVGKNDSRDSKRSFSFTTNSTIDVISYAQGGGVPEGVDSIKYYAPRSYQAQGRAVTAEDYKTLISTQYGDVESVFVYGGEDSIPPQYGKVFISIKPQSGTSLTDFEKDSISKSILEGNNIVSIIPELIDPEYIYILVDSTVIYDPARTVMTPGAVRQLIKTDILQYSNTDLEKFGNDFFFSKFSTRIDSLDDSIKGNETTIKLQRRLEPNIGSAAGYVLNFYNPIHHPHDGHMEGVVSSSTFKYKNEDGIVVDAFILDNGSGILILYTLVGGVRTKLADIGTVNYNTGSLDLVSFNPVQDTTSSTIKFNVQPRDRNVFSSRNILLQIDPLDVDSVKVRAKDYIKGSMIGTTDTDLANRSVTLSSVSSTTSTSTSTTSTTTTSTTGSSSSSGSGSGSGNGSGSGSGSY